MVDQILFYEPMSRTASSLTSVMPPSKYLPNLGPPANTTIKLRNLLMPNCKPKFRKPNRRMKRSR